MISFWISVVPIDLTLRWAAYRTVASLVVGLAALAPLLAGDAWRAIRLPGLSSERPTTASVHSGTIAPSPARP